jgi:hypothetical protein
MLIQVNPDLWRITQRQVFHAREFYWPRFLSAAKALLSLRPVPWTGLVTSPVNTASVRRIVPRSPNPVKVLAGRSTGKVNKARFFAY